MHAQFAMLRVENQLFVKRCMFIGDILEHGTGRARVEHLGLGPNPVLTAQVVDLLVHLVLLRAQAAEQLADAVRLEPAEVEARDGPAPVGLGHEQVLLGARLLDLQVEHHDRLAEDLLQLEQVVQVEVQLDLLALHLGDQVLQVLGERVERLVGHLLGVHAAGLALELVLAQVFAHDVLPVEVAHEALARLRGLGVRRADRVAARRAGRARLAVAIKR